MTQPLADIHVTVEPGEPELVHITEHDDGYIALCGYDLTDAEQADDPVQDADLCVVCVDLLDAEIA